MGTFWRTVQVGNPAGGDLVEVEALVDTGADDSMFPQSLLSGLHLQPQCHFDYTMADGRIVSYPYGQARISIDGTAWICPVVFGPEEDALLGATTLEIFKLVADPVRKRLLPASVLRLGWADETSCRFAG